MHTAFKRYITLLILLLVFLSHIGAQERLELHLNLGVSNYQGDLQPSPFTIESAGGAFGINLRYGFSEKFFVRTGFSSGNIKGDDKKNKPELQPRNLNFTSAVHDLHIGLEYRFFKPQTIGLTPYVFAGFGGFKFNPYTTYGDKNERVYLQPLGTEGQGLPEYPDREMYNLTQISIPFGGGLLWYVNERFMLGIEFRQNKTFTDYLDDVSNTYALQGPLLRDRGPVAVEVAWRRDEIDGRPYPNGESKRGDPGFQDWFYQVGFSAGFTLPNGVGFGGGRMSRQKLKQFGCPKW
jgi:opacity protein-like surface antigen